jgi:hypothetical protein
LEGKVTNYYNGPFTSDPVNYQNIRESTNALRDVIEAAERCDKMCDEFAAEVHASEKAFVIDVGSAGGSHEDAVYFSEQLKRRKCKSFVQGTKIFASGEAFEKAMEREALKPIHIEPLPRDPEVEKRIWMWQSAFFW